MNNSTPALADINNITSGSKHLIEELGWGFFNSCFVYQDYVELEFPDGPIDLTRNDKFCPVYVKVFKPHRASVCGRPTLFVDCGRTTVVFYSYGYATKEDAEEIGVLFRDTLLRHFVANQQRCDPGHLNSLLRPEVVGTSKFYMQDNGFIQFVSMPLSGGSGASAPIFRTASLNTENVSKFLVAQPISKASRRALAMKADFILLNSRGIGGSGDQAMADLTINVSLIESFVKRKKVDIKTRGIIDDVNSYIDDLNNATPEQKEYIKQGLGNLKRKSIRKSVLEFVEEEFPVGSFTASGLEITDQTASQLMDLCYNLRSKYFHEAAHQDINVSNLEEHDLARYLVEFAGEIATQLIEKNL